MYVTVVVCVYVILLYIGLVLNTNMTTLYYYIGAHLWLVLNAIFFTIKNIFDENF